MSDEENGFCPQNPHDALLKDLSPDRSVERAEGIVEEDDVIFGVHGPSQINPRLLTSRERGPSVTYDRVVPARKETQVLFQGTGFKDSCVPDGFVFSSEKNILANATTEYPGLLWHKGDLSRNGDLTRDGRKFSKDGLEERTLVCLVHIELVLPRHK